jgi:hypothetical protein
MNNIAVGIVQAVCYLSFVGLIVAGIFWLLDNWTAGPNVRSNARRRQIREHFKAKAEAEKHIKPMSIWQWIGVTAVILFVITRIVS